MKKRKRILSLALAAFLMLSLMTGCGHSRTTKETEETTFGIDVARYQGTIDWQQVAQSGVQFAMVRLGYRNMSQGEIVEDCNARYNLQEASKAGIALGAYFFSTAVTEEEAVEEAKWAAQILNDYPITYPVAYDCEGFQDPDSRQYSLSKEERTDIALAFLKTIERLGYEGMFYGSKNELQFDTKWETTRIAKRYKIWVAQYPESPYPESPQSSYPDDHHMWQYSMTGSIPGIGQNVDLNIAYFGYDGIEPRRAKEEPKEASPDVEAMMNFTVVEEQVTAKVETNLRNAPSQGEESQVVYTLQNGEVAQRVAVSADGWSKLIFNGQTVYAVTSYLTTDLGYDPNAATQDSDGDGIQTQFSPVSEQVTAKDKVNLRRLPSVEREDAAVIGQLSHGDVAQRVGVSDNGWSKLEYNGETCYAVSSYLMLAGDAPVETASTVPETPEIQTQFESISDRVTAKVEVNLRSLPSVDNPDCVVVASIKNGEVVERTGINRDVGWSRVVYNGQTLYCVTRYLTEAD